MGLGVGSRKTGKLKPIKVSIWETIGGYESIGAEWWGQGVQYGSKDKYNNEV